MIVTFSLAGCATFSINKVKYYNEVLATVGETHITRFDLLTAYNSYGYSYYVSQQGKSEEDALRSTLEYMIDRELIYQHILEKEDENPEFTPTEYQVNVIVENIFESVDSQMEDYIKESKKILNIKVDESTEDETDDETLHTYENYVYSPRAKLVSENGVDKIVYITEKEPTSYDKLINSTNLINFKDDSTIIAIRDAYLDHFESNLNDEESTNANALFNKSIGLLTEDLIEYEYYLRDSQGKKLTKNTNDLLFRYFERTFNSQIQSQYIENFRTEYLKSETLSISSLIEKFQSLARVSYTNYHDEDADYKSDMKSTSTKHDTILYHPTLEDGTKFGYFTHTLLKFDNLETQIKALEKINDPVEKENKRHEIISLLEVTPRNEDGTSAESPVKLADIIDEYNQITKIVNYDEKLAEFTKFMFKYTGDTATLSSSMPYVVGTNGNSSMEEAFTNEAIKLLETGTKGAMSKVDVQKIENMCITSYGVHFLFFVGDVNSFDVLYSDIESAYIASQNKVVDKIDYGYLNLYGKTLNPLTNETYFDMLFDAVYPADDDGVFTTKNGYSAEETRIADANENKVTRFETKIKSTKVKI